MKENFNDDKPTFNSAMGSVMLIDDLIREASRAFVKNDLKTYHNYLESWYHETGEVIYSKAKETEKEDEMPEGFKEKIIWRIKKAQKGSISTQDIIDLEKIRNNCNNKNDEYRSNLMKYHRIMTSLTKRAGLRITETKENQNWEDALREDFE